jgi:hypothetical protein
LHVARQQQALPGAYCEAVLGFEFGAETGRQQALVVDLVAQVAQVQFVGAVVGDGVALQRDAGLAGGVVEDQLAVGAAAPLARCHGLAFETRQHRRVRMAVADAGEPGRRVAGGGAGAVVALRIRGVIVAGVVVKDADDEGAVNVAIGEIKQHFLAHARHGDGAPVLAGDGGEHGGHAHPGATGVVGRGAAVAVRDRVHQAAVAALAAYFALPMELYLDAVVAVGVDDRSFRADDNRRLLATDGGARVEPAAGPVADGSRNGLDAVAVNGRVKLPAETGCDGGLHGGIKIVAHGVGHAGQQEGPLGRAVEYGVAVERERGAGCEAAHGARRSECRAAGADGVELTLGSPLALLFVGIGVLAGGVAVGHFGRGRVQACDDRPRAVGAVVPARQRDSVGQQARCAAPVVDAIFAHDGA